MTALTKLPAVVVALVGRPNSGKTSLLMHLTGSSQRPVNFPGTSVERTESLTRGGGVTLRIVDLPGIVSLHASSRDEQVTIDYLQGHGDAVPDVVCAVLDAGKLAIELRLLQRLRALQRPLVIALTKVDVAAAEGRPIDVAQLQRALGLPLVVLNGFTGEGSGPLRTALESAAAAAPPELRVALDSVQLAADVRLPGRATATWTDRIDRVLLHPAIGPLTLSLVMLVVFQLVFTAAEPFVAVVETCQDGLSSWLRAAVPDGALQSFLVEGLVHGLGSVFVFVPQIALLTGLVALLESSGYMARAVFLLDRLLRKFGLTGRSFVPLTGSFACAIPGILASRILADERDRIATIVVAPLMSCSARLPVYVVLLAAFFEPFTAGFVLFGLYLIAAGDGDAGLSTAESASDGAHDALVGGAVSCLRRQCDSDCHRRGVGAELLSARRRIHGGVRCPNGSGAGRRRTASAARTIAQRRARRSPRTELPRHHRQGDPAGVRSDGL